MNFINLNLSNNEINSEGVKFITISKYLSYLKTLNSIPTNTIRTSAKNKITLRVKLNYVNIDNQRKQFQLQ